MDGHAAWEHHYAASGAASSSARKLCFTGIGLIWIFSGGSVGNAAEVTIDGEYLWPLALLVLALACDFLQYVYLSLVWRLFARSMEIETHEQREGALIVNEAAPVDRQAPAWINWPAEGVFALKLLLVGVGYVWLIVALAPELLD